MKRILAMLLACVMLLGLCACGGGEETVQVTPEPTPEVTATPEPTPQYVHPLNGSLLDEPYTGRIFASTICNTPNAIPHISLNRADIVFEMFVNGSVIRDFALFSDIQSVEVFGSIRSTRPMFHQLSDMYDAILIHSGGSDFSISDAFKRKIDHISVDTYEARIANTCYRDEEYGRDYEASLFGLGQACYDFAVATGKRVEQPADKDYGLHFVDDGTPADGEAADNITITFRQIAGSKITEMKYDPEMGKYVYYQYDREMRDLMTDEVEAFTNVIVMLTDIFVDTQYQKGRFTEGGTGWYACGGKLIPITWECEGEESPLRFYREDGTPLDMGRGNTYIAIALDTMSEASWS